MTLPGDSAPAPRRTLRVRVFSLVCVLVISFVVALSLMSLEDLADLVHEDFEAKGELAADYFARTSVEGILIEDEIGLAEATARLFEVEDVVYAGIYDSERTLILREATIQVDGLEVLDARRGDETAIRELRVGAGDGIRVLDYTVAVFDEQGERIGWIRTGISLEGIDGKIWGERLASLGLVAGFIAVALVLIFLVANSIANPIKALANQAEYVASSRDYSVRAEKGRNDEIGLLVDGFNAMLSQIEAQQTALTRSEERFRALVETSSDWIWELDRDGQYTYSSPKVTDLLGYDPDEVVGKKPADFMTAPGARSFDAAFSEMARRKEPLLHLETQSLHRDGSHVVLETNTVPILGADGELVGYRGIDRDITDRKRMEDELEAQRTLDQRTDRLRSLGEMAAGIAHELNQPLMGVRGLAEHFVIGLDRGWQLTEDTIRDRSNRIVEQVDRMVHIIEHIRMFAREAGRPETELVQINDVVQSTLVMVGAQFRAHSLDLVLELAEDVPDVRLNRYSLEEVLLNLLSNARDAVEDLPVEGEPSPGPQIRMRTSTDGDAPTQCVKLEVIDNGIGFAPELLDRVFDPFFTTKDPDRGTGLGLSISRSIVEEFGGSIQIQSTPGVGTTVAVRVPPADI